MRLELSAREITVVLSRRNLLALIHKLDMPGSARTLVGRHTLADGAQTAAPALIVKVEGDEEHYAKRAAGPGEMHPETEEFIADADDTEASVLVHTAVQALGLEGQMLSASKTNYQDNHPDHVAIFNANVCVGARKVWHGDFDVTRDEEQLHELARRTGQVVSVLHERDGRFEHERDPLVALAVFSVAPSGHTMFKCRSFERAADGILRRRPARSAGSKL